jgi:hypothetical protein
MYTLSLHIGYGSRGLCLVHNDIGLARLILGRHERTHRCNGESKACSRRYVVHNEEVDL